MTQGQQRVLLAAIDATGLPRPEFEVRFAPPRRWRADALWSVQKLALEVEGGYAIGGRHTRVGGFLKDAEKYNELACLGYRLLRVTPRQIQNGEALAWLQRVLESASCVRPGRPWELDDE